MFNLFSFSSQCLSYCKVQKRMVPSMTQTSDPTSPSLMMTLFLSYSTGYIHSTISRICVTGKFFMKSLSWMARLIRSLVLTNQSPMSHCAITLNTYIQQLLNWEKGKLSCRSTYGIFLGYYSCCSNGSSSKCDARQLENEQPVVMATSIGN